MIEITYEECDDYTPAEDDMIDELAYMLDLAARAAEYEEMMEEYGDGNAREIY